MKRTLTLLLVLCFVRVNGAELIGYATGAWWTTKAPKFTDRTAGEVDLYFYDDRTVDVCVWFDGDLIQEGSGQWLDKPLNTKVTFTFSNPSVYTWSGTLRFDNSTNFFGQGTFKSAPLGSYAGRWQVTSN